MKKCKNNNITVVDLFCGGGIGAVGVKMAGFNIIYSLDFNKFAVDTYNKNIGNHCHCKDIKKMDLREIPKSDIILASPTCKTFSFAGNNKGFLDKIHGDLSYYFLEVLKLNKPKIFVFENVKGMVSKKHIEYFKAFLREIELVGYRLTYKVLNAYNYGVPQLRERLILVGIRNDINKEFVFPDEVSECEKKNIYDAIFDLTQPRMVMNSKKDIQYINNKDTLTKNHIGFGIRNDEKEFIDKIPSGSNWRSLSEEDAKKFLGKAFYNGGGKTGFLRKIDVSKPSYTITSTMNGKNNAQIIDSKDILNYEHKNIRNQDIYLESGYSTRYKSRNRQKQWNEPSFTIVSEARQLPLYPEPKNYDIRTEKNISPPRRFTVRECLRLQSVPDLFVIDESISLQKQYEIVGNGIPSLIIYKIFKNIEKILI